jgi:hypothetical protein
MGVSGFELGSVELFSALYAEADPLREGFFAEVPGR